MGIEWVYASESEKIICVDEKIYFKEKLLANFKDYFTYLYLFIIT